MARSAYLRSQTGGPPKPARYSGPQQVLPVAGGEGLLGEQP
ncbi:hypothetical protein ACHGLA_00860 [Streptomyces sp. YH02]